MTADDKKNDLLAQFKDYLQAQLDDEALSSPPPDLNTLLTEISCLKTEVKAESRQFKNTLDELQAAFKQLEQDRKQDEYQQRLLLQDFLEIYDSLYEGLEILNHYRPVNGLFRHSCKQDIHFIKQFRQGQQMTLKRLEQLLQRHQIIAMDCQGKVFDTETMTVVETGADRHCPNGVVLAELRKGFLYQGQVFRLAEVKVNKLEDL